MTDRAVHDAAPNQPVAEDAAPAAASSAVAPTRRPRWLELVLPVVASLVVFGLAWQLVVFVTGYPSFILPGPYTVAERFVRAFNRAHPECRATVFHVFMWACRNGLAEFPGLNRFVAGGRLYQRRGIWVSYSAKVRPTTVSVVVPLAAAAASASIRSTLRRYCGSARCTSLSTF